MTDEKKGRFIGYVIGLAIGFGVGIATATAVLSDSVSLRLKFLGQSKIVHACFETPACVELAKSKLWKPDDENLILKDSK